MFCEQCGSAVEGDAAFCEVCGAPVEVVQQDGAAKNTDGSIDEFPVAFCESCGAKLDPGSAFCEGCGTAVVGCGAEGSDAVGAVMSQAAFCESCGAKLDSGSAFCEECGAAVAGLESQFVPADRKATDGVSQPKRGKRGKFIAIGIAAVVAVIAIAVGVSGMGGEGGQTETQAEDALSAIAGDVSDSAGAEASAEGGFPDLFALFDGAEGQTQAGETAQPDTVAPAESVASQGVSSLADAHVGDVIEFGSYPNGLDGADAPITWTVVSENDGHLLLLSEKALDCRPIAESGSSATGYADCSLRAWLNGDFMRKAFSEEDRSRIDFTAEAEPTGYSYDTVFILDDSEIRSVLSTEQAQIGATDYAVSRGVKCDDDGLCKWWTCSSSATASGNEAGVGSPFYAVLSSGTIGKDSYDGAADGIGVRPAIGVSTGSSYAYVLFEQGTVSFSSKPFEDAQNAQDPLLLENRNVVEANSTRDSFSGLVQLNAEASNGDVLGDLIRVDANGFVIVDSSTREYTKEELRALGLTPGELCIAWNEPFAREGYSFKNSGLRSYFASMPWYHPGSGSGTPTSAGSHNVQLLHELAAESAEALRWESLAAK